MNVDAPSIVANRMYAFGEAFAVAKAFVVSLMGGDDTVLTSMETDITVVGGLALPARDPATYPWYRGGTLFADAPASGSSVATLAGLNVAGQAGKVVETDGYGFVLGTGGGGGGYASLGAFDTTPNAKGLSAAGTAVSLSKADATNPGGVVPDTQNLGDHKTIGGCLIASDAAGGIGSNGLRLNADVSGLYYGIGNTIVYASADITFMQGGGFVHTMNLTLFGGVPTLDLTGGGNGGQIKLKSPDGTTYTLSVANGGTLSIV